MNTYNCKEFAKKCNVCTTTLWKWHRDGVLLGRFTPGGRRFYTDWEYEEYLKGGKEAKDGGQ